MRSNLKQHQCALVTGASKGLGAAISKRLASDGFSVAVNYLNDEESAKNVVNTIRQQGGVAESFRADVTDRAEVSRLITAIEGTLGTIQVLIINATGPQPLYASDELTWEIMVEQLEYFVKSPVLLMTELLPGMKKRQYGRIIHIGSNVVDSSPLEMSAYTAAKCAQLGLARTWAKELAPFNINVNTVAPGWIPVERHSDVPEQELEEYKQGLPAGRMGSPEDIASAVSFLASVDASFVVGSKLRVNGGSTLD